MKTEHKEVFSTSHADAFVPQSVLPDPRQPRLSIARLLVLFAALGAVAAGTFYVITHRARRAAASAVAGTVFAPYVDVTLTPTYPFQDPAANPVRRVYLGFIVAKPSSACTPSWGGYYTLSDAEQALSLDERIAQVRSQGGTPVLSFGGQANTELAVSCRSVPALTRAYLRPIRRYQVAAIDLDIEGASVTNATANRRRASALAAAQRLLSARGTPLSIWLTLPVTPDGLTAAGLDAVRSLLAAHVRLTGVNVLAMDFGGPVRDMITPVERAVSVTHGQLESVGLAHGSQAAWSRLGVTVMIGMNDVPGEVFTLTDAGKLKAFAAARHLARVSMWSINRDSQCGTLFAQTGVLSNSCSGVKQTPLEYTRIFSGLAGTETATASATEAGPVPAVQAAPVDDPNTSPYPIWRPQAMYDTGFKVVWHRKIYQAKWFSQGTAPDAPVDSAAQTSWLLIGPVLAGATPARPLLRDTSPEPQWSPTMVYQYGARVLYHGLPFSAKWYTQGNPPETALPADPNSPWQPLYSISGEPAGAVTG